MNFKKFSVHGFVVDFIGVPWLFNKFERGFDGLRDFPQFLGIECVLMRMSAYKER